MEAALVWISSVVLAAVFAWAAVAKLVRFPAWRRALSGYGFSSLGERVGAPVVPLAEVATCVVLLGVSVRVGAALGLAMVALFSLAVLRARSIKGDRLPCGCFGGEGERDYRLLLVRNAALAVLSGVILVSGERPGLFAGMEAPAAGDILPAALAAIGILLVAVASRQALTMLRRRPS